MDRCSNRTLGLLAAGLAGAAALAVIAGEPVAAPPGGPSAAVELFRPSGVVRPLPPADQTVTQAAYPSPEGRRLAVFDWQSRGPALPGDETPSDEVGRGADGETAVPGEAIIVLPEDGALPRGADGPSRQAAPPALELAPSLPDRTTLDEPPRRTRPPRVARRAPQDPWGDDDAAAAEIPAPQSMPEIRPRTTQPAPARPAVSTVPTSPPPAASQPAPRRSVIPVLRRREAPQRSQPVAAPRVALGPVEDASVTARATDGAAIASSRATAGSQAVGTAPQSAIPDVVSHRALDEVRRGFELAERRAFFSARNAFHAALRDVAEALDTASGTTEHVQALAAGFRAMEEADDFTAEENLPEPNATAVAAIHRTPVLRGAPLEIAPAQARRQYHAYAQEQFAAAVAGEPAGAAALFGLGKLHTVLGEARPPVVAAAAAKSLVYYQATLAVDPQDAAAANELGVALAREGRYAEARDWLVRSALLAPRKETWHNLATVHERLGEADLAARARAEMRLAVSGGAGTPGSRVEWVDPLRFAARNETAAPAAARAERTAGASSAADRTPKRGLSRWLPWK